MSTWLPGLPDAQRHHSRHQVWADPLRHDHGSQYLAHDFQAEIRFLGITASPAFVREPEGNGCAERFIRTLKENLLWLRAFQTVEELRQALLDFKRQYNEHWILERLGYRTPARARQDRLADLAEAVGQTVARGSACITTRVPSPKGGTQGEDVSGNSERKLRRAEVAHHSIGSFNPLREMAAALTGVRTAMAC
jgi:hypothetical protein